MSFNITYKIAVEEIDGTLGMSGKYVFPVSGASSYAPTYRQTVDGSYADATSEETIALGEITTASGMILISDQTLTLNIDGEDLVITANQPFCAFNLSFSALKVSNASGSTATLRGVIYGD